MKFFINFKTNNIMKTTSKIFSEIATQGFATENQICLIKRRANNGQYSEVFAAWEEYLDGGPIKVTAEQGAKGRAWLQSFIGKRGQSIKGAKLQPWQIEAIRAIADDDFYLVDLYDNGRCLTHFEPVYCFGKGGECYEYFYDNGKIGWY